MADNKLPDEYGVHNEISVVRRPVERGVLLGLKPGGPKQTGQ